MTTKYDFSRAKRGPVVPLPPGKTEIIFAIDEDVLEWFRSQVHQLEGGDYQVLMNEALQAYMQEHYKDRERIVQSAR